ncbi:hypothetical protein GCM10023190_22190 [Enteractinococcus fodinae]|uniref:Uncharacterized protein n=1 Tax=Enteractinococcus fodinae TaxID=684663 RepID=A0ABU2B360_9MICC|nr:hypothetical protein [Enteractinococcus fodinae]MDR7348025.1 hypothetical protein [Enteractinococcus fodinae]
MLRTATTVAALTLLTVTGCTANPGEASSASSPEATEATPAPQDSEQSEPTFAETDMPYTDVEIDGPFAAEALDHLLTTLTTVYHDNVGNGNYTEDCDVPFETLEDYQNLQSEQPCGVLGLA